MDNLFTLHRSSSLSCRQWWLFVYENCLHINCTMFELLPATPIVAIVVLMLAERVVMETVVMAMAITLL